MRLDAFDVDHEADAAGLVLETRIVQALLAGQPACIDLWLFHFNRSRGMAAALWSSSAEASS
jgi:hypothetical protein